MLDISENSYNLDPFRLSKTIIMTLTGAFLTLGGAFAAYETFRFLSVKEMSFSLATVQASQSAFTTNVVLGVNVTNPSTWSNTLDGLDGDIYANGNFIGHASVLGPIPVPAYAGRDIANPPTTIPIHLSLSDVSMAAIILSIIAGTTAKAEITFVGRVLADGIPWALPVDITYQVL